MTAPIMADILVTSCYPKKMVNGRFMKLPIWNYSPEKAAILGNYLSIT
jgi:hypothetical protein